MRVVHIGSLTRKDTDGGSTTEVDSHADTCVVGRHALVFHDFDRPVNVTGYDEGKGTTEEDCKTVSAALAYDDPRTGEVIILVVHQAILIPHLEINLLCPMQLRINDVKISEVPKFLTDNPTDDTHSIQFPSQYNGDEPYTIPLSLKGVTSYFPTRKPTQQEFNDCERYKTTYELPDWDPHATIFAEQEATMTDSSGFIRERDAIGARGRQFIIAGVTSDTPTPSPRSNENTFSEVLKNNRNVSGLGTGDFKTGIEAQSLVKKWGIGLDAAKRTLKKTTQRGVRTVLHPSLSRRFRTNDRQMR